MSKKMNLGFGIMRFQNDKDVIEYEQVENTLVEYMKGDFCYFDLHPAYVTGKAQTILKEYIVDKYQRNAYMVANKMPYYGIFSYDDYERMFESELLECGLDYFDYYMLHAVTGDVNEIHNLHGGYEFLKQKKKEGLILNIGISFHDKPALLNEILSKHTELDFVQLQINWLDWNDPVICARENYEIAKKYGKKIIVMEPLKGGTLLKELSDINLVNESFRFLSGLSRVDVVLSGMTNSKQVIENRKIISNLNNDLVSDKDIINDLIYDKLRKKYNELNIIKCTSCGYCVRECPSNIPIPEITQLLNSYTSLSDGRQTFLGGARATYRSVTYKKGKAGECISCGKCEKRCPQKLEIRKNMKNAKGLFEENHFYSAERNVQILVYLLKENGIKRIVISPGTTNICFVQSVQSDPFFIIYSAADERSAAYLATGIARESGEPVVISCTGATASRNYVSALTEAYYSHLPIIAVTASQPIGRIGHLVPQMIDRTSVPNDIAYLSVEMPLVKENDEENEWICSINANKAIIEVLDERKGPVHINMITSFNSDFSIKNIKPINTVRRHKSVDINMFRPSGKVCIFVGAHVVWSDDLIKYVDSFCEKFDAIVISDHTGNYTGKYGITNSLLLTQEKQNPLNDFELVIHMGNISGAYYNLNIKRVWRISPDGEVIDTFRKLTDVFEMREDEFFKSFMSEDVEGNEISNVQQITKWKTKENEVRKQIPDIPFSNIWIAQQTIEKLPKGSEVHFGILNSLRAWNIFDLPKDIIGFSNTGGFGIDGCLSTLIGASLVNNDKLFFGIVGDLAFFYDMNALGNRHIGNNIRLLVVNNGCGTEFMNYNHAASVLSDSEKEIIAAKGHYGKQSNNLLRSYSESLGFKYLCAHDKEEYLANIADFVNCDESDKSIVFEVFTEPEKESEALRLINTIDGISSHVDQKTECAMPDRFMKQKEKRTLVLWGTGYCFIKNITNIKQRINPDYVCDNNELKWGNDIEGVRCISPKDLSKLNNPFVVIMIENVNVAFQIANQLIEMGITEFDVYANWKNYAKEFCEILYKGED